jgi:hypothetical protein
MEKPLWVEIIRQMQEVELLSDDSYHTSQRRSHGVRPWHSPLLVELVGEPSAHPMGLAFHTRNAVAHGEEERPIREIAWEQPEPVIAKIQHDTPLRQLRRQLGARHDSDRPTVRRLQH